MNLTPGTFLLAEMGNIVIGDLVRSQLKIRAMARIYTNESMPTTKLHNPCINLTDCFSHTYP